MDKSRGFLAGLGELCQLMRSKPLAGPASAPLVVAALAARAAKRISHKAHWQCIATWLSSSANELDRLKAPQYFSSLS